MEQLLKYAKELNEEESGGMGDKWDLFGDDTRLTISKILPVAAGHGKVLINEMEDRTTIPEGVEPVAVLYYPIESDDASGSDGGVVTLLLEGKNDEGEKINELCSMFPMFYTDIRYGSAITLIELFPNRCEARLWLSIPNLPFSVCIFDTMFGVHRSKYISEANYEVILSGMAYRMRSTAGDEYRIEDEESIARHRATDAWVKKHGSFYRDTDLETALAEWNPESSEDLEPVVFDLSRMRSYMPHDIYADDGQFAGEVVRVYPNAIEMFGVSFWRVDVAVAQFETDEENSFIIPYFIPENRFEGEWRPNVGEWVSGNGWHNGYINVK